MAYVQQTLEPAKIQQNARSTFAYLSLEPRGTRISRLRILLVWGSIPSTNLMGRWKSPICCSADPKNVKILLGGNPIKIVFFHVSFYDTAKLAHVAGFEMFKKDFCCSISFGNVYKVHTYCCWCPSNYFWLIELL